MYASYNCHNDLSNMQQNYVFETYAQVYIYKKNITINM